jgi:hypothetical protein
MTIENNTYSPSEKYFFARSHLSFLLFTKKMFYTRALMSAIDTWKLDSGKRAPAYISAGRLITVCIDSSILDMCIQPFNISDSARQMDSHMVEINKGFPIEVSPYVPMLMVFHEIRHVPQMHTQKVLSEQILLPEILEKLKEHRRPMHSIVNICMDMTLHRDILKIPEIRKGFDQLNSILTERSIKEVIDNAKSEDVAKVEKYISETRGKNVLCLIEEFDKHFPKPEGYEDYFAENLDWAALTNIAYLRLKEKHERDQKEKKEDQEQEKSEENDGEKQPGDQNESEDGQKRESEEDENSKNGNKESNQGKGKGKKPNKNKLFDDESEGFDGENGFDEHDNEGDESSDMTEEEKEEVRKDRARRLEQAMREAEVVGKEQAGKHGGHDAGDATMFVKERNPDNQIVKLISKIKSKVMTLSGKPDYEASWKLTRNRGGFCIPTERERGTKKTPAVVLVLDVSGSMWNTETLSQSFSVARGLMKRGRLAALYQGDTVLTRCDKQAQRSTGTIIGGGGTELDMSQVRQIRQELKIPENDLIDIVYVTDGYVDLREIMADPKTRLHVVLNRDGDLEAPQQVGK